MTKQDSNKERSSERNEENKHYNSPTPGGERRFPEYYGNRSRDTEPFSDPASEWQRTGHTSDQSWWESGTDQQQQTYAGDTKYPYRENDWERNQQGQAGIENYYPQEPASEQQRQHFAEGSQSPYEGGYGAANLQAREGLERANEWEARDQDSDRNRQYPNRNQETNQNLNRGRPAETNYRSNYEDRKQEYGRERNRAGDRDYGYDGGRGGQRYDRYNEPEDFRRERDFRAYDRNRDYGRNPNEGFGRNYKQDHGYGRYEGRSGRYHNTETDNPGQGFNAEWEMNRNANRGGYNRDRDYGSNDRNYRGGRDYNRPHGDRLASSHRATGPYEDFEHDREKYGIEGNYQERYRSYDRADRDREGNTDFNYRPGEEAGHRRRSNQFRDRGWERSPGGKRGPADSEYRSRYEDDRGRY